MIDIEACDMLALVKQKVADKEPVSIVRYGDGEAIVLNGFKDIYSLKSVMKRQFGYIPFVEEIEAIRENLISAYAGADIIGIATKNRFMDDEKSYWYKGYGILNDSIGIGTMLEKKFTNIDFAYNWVDNNCYAELLTGAETVCYISCRNIDQQLKDTFKIKEVFSYIIAPEMKFTSGYEGVKHFPDQFNKIQKWVTKVPVEGNICLTGAGVAGKIYNNWFRDLGGIAIDVGSVFDSFAGKLTRGPGRGMDVEDKTYKL